MRPGLVIFDCDGVLVDTERLGNQRLSALLTEAGYPISYEDCRRTFVGKPMAAVQADVEATGVVLGPDFVQRWNDGLPALFAAGMVARGKPFPDLFLHAAKTMGYAPEACIVVEDSVAGVTAARAAGMRALAYAGDHEADRDRLTAAGGELFDNMRELPRLIGIG